MSAGIWAQAAFKGENSKGNEIAKLLTKLNELTNSESALLSALTYGEVRELRERDTEQLELLKGRKSNLQRMQYCITGLTF